MSSDPQTWAIRYLAARGDTPWRWADDGNVLAWADGTTIAFRDEIAGILELLTPRGWPNFGALVWVLAACRGKLPPPSREPRYASLPDYPAQQPGSSDREHQVLLSQFTPG